uniref:Uncharacterized protein n=1 Tax=Panagrolaimus sp. PS1159 TaxID=55785 RepID=A0AC35GQD7_9BILA
MKYLIVSCFIFAAVQFAYFSECDSNGRESLCLEGNEEKCFDVETYTKAFGINAGVKLLRYDALWHFTCNAEYKPTKEDKKCEDENSIEALCKEGDPSCEDIKKRLDCIKKTSMEKCENEKLAQFRVDAYTYTVQKILPNCNV